MSLQVIGGLFFAACLGVFSLASLTMWFARAGRGSETWSLRQACIDLLLPTTTLIVTAVMIWSLLSGHWQKMARLPLGSLALAVNLVVVTRSTQWNRSRSG